MKNPWVKRAKAEAKKKKLLDMANGRYDSEFDAAIRKLKPHWWAT